ncbi:MAG TPA: hypothetical protein VMT00_09055 [Thermoanaerobaculia bacterium]|nr:hypothetical protein [Thermoanaerobaculia bacterium]
MQGGTPESCPTGRRRFGARLVRRRVDRALEQTNGKLFGLDGAAQLPGMQATTLASLKEKAAS